MTWRKISKQSFVFALSILLCLCTVMSCDQTNEGGTGIANPPTLSSSLVSSMTVMFNDAGSVAQVILPHFLNRIVQQAQAEMTGTCASTPPEGLNYDFSADTDDFTDSDTETYGSVQNPITLELDDFCVDRNNTSVENDATGPDGLGLFLVYRFRIDEISTTICTNADGSTSFQLGGQGVYRQTEDETQIYGVFHALHDDGEFEANCSLILNVSNGSVKSSLCSDVDTGAALELATDDITCTVTTTASE